MRIEVEFVYPTPFCGGMSSWFSEPVGNLPFRLPHSVEISGNASHTQLLCGSAKRVGRLFPIKTGSPPLRSRDRCKITVGNVLAERRPRNRVTGGSVVKRVAGDWAKLPGPDEGEARGHIAIRLAPRDKIKQLSASLSQRESLRFHQRIKGKSTEESTSLSAIPSSPPHSKSMLFPPADYLKHASSHWCISRDGDELAYEMARRHYSARNYREQRQRLFVGPGRKLILISNDGKALFVWRKFIDDCQPVQSGYNCAIFRNEGDIRSSTLIIEAVHIVYRLWGRDRCYTLVNPAKIKSSNPGCCFKKAGWNKCGISKTGKIILELPHIPLMQCVSSSPDDLK